ncbi:AraC family transcriptional regulator [Chitinophaga lutea]|uniref:AraC family transcriptional regulator n=1 Tax=Chitinophaga lutea TaxID=2488634 RepID=A0A3N4Q038_9BACT|nr:AraC family transcriptional regulator [Chitinophaga lutea]RPE14423.1 AraC family transcriptional regulator [Chitinophaga lutea]
MEDQRKRMALNLLAFAAQRDADVPQLCRLSGFPKGLPGKEPVTPRQLEQLWLNTGHMLNDPLVGLHLGESLQAAALGVVGEIVQSSATAGEALTLAASLAHLVTDLFTMEVVQHGKSFTVRYVPLKDQTSFVFRQLMDFFMVFTIHELDGLLLQKIKPKAVRFPYTMGEPAEYERVLRCKPGRRAGEFSIEFDGRYWDEPVITANYELQRMLLQKAHAIAPPAPEQSLHARIHHYLLTNAYLGIISLEDIAANFNTSARSLQRRLKDEGVKFQDVADDVRKTLALHYLSSGNYPLKEVSGMLGYNELSAFTRAFKRWTGNTPGHYQQN